MKYFKPKGLGNWDLALAFGIKSIASLIFLYIFTWHYGKGFLLCDSFFYINDGEILNSVIYKSPKDFFKLFTGIGETEELIQQYLSNTNMWSRPYNVINNDTKNIIRINSVISFFSFKNIYIHFIIFNLFALSGLTNIYSFFKNVVSINSRILFYSIIFLPSLLFWSSGVLKEPLLFFSIGLFLRFISSKKLHIVVKVLLTLIAAYMLLNFKAYVLIAMLSPLFFVFLSKKVFITRTIFFSLLMLVSSIVLAILIFPKQRQKVVTYISVKQFDFENIGRGGLYFLRNKDSNAYFISPEDYSKIKVENDSFVVVQELTSYSFNRKTKDHLRKNIEKPDSSKKQYISSVWVRSNSYIKTKLIFNSFNQLIKNIPQALVNSLFRPFPTDRRTKFNYIQFIETSLLFLFLIFAFFKRKKLNRNEQILVVALILFVLILSLMIGWTTPVAGAIVRYRLPTYLALLLIAFIIYNPHEKWKMNKNIS